MTHRIRRSMCLTLLAGATAAAISCGPHARTTRFSAHPPRPETHEIETYASTLPDRPYEEIGLVSASENWFESMDDLLAALKEEARKMGGDAIIGLEEVHDAEDPTLAGTVVRYVSEEESTPGKGG